MQLVKKAESSYAEELFLIGEATADKPHSINAVSVRQITANFSNQRDQARSRIVNVLMKTDNVFYRILMNDLIANIL